MQASNFSLPQYLQRINFDATPQPTLESISALMRAQLFTVPFENTDVQQGKVVSLTPEDIVDKIVHQRRGGYCYEVNGVFAMALTALGIPYKMVAARPMFYPVRRPKTHMALIVTLEGADYLIDLGFGSYGIRAPIAMRSVGTETHQDHDCFKLSRLDDGEILLQALTQGAWTNQFSFPLDAVEWIDFVPANFLNSTHPDAIFVQKLLLVQHRADGRDILVGNTLKQIRKGEISTRELDGTARWEMVHSLFGSAVAQHVAR